MAVAPILVVDDDSRMASLVSVYLEREGFRVLMAGDGLTALEMARRQSLNLMILDVLLPGLSGFEVCRQLREFTDLPVVMLTVRGDVEDRVAGLRAGADDYISKPFSPPELIARVKAILRRTSPGDESHQLLCLHGVEADVARYQVTVDGAEVALTAFEFKLLITLMEHPGRVFTREELLASVYADVKMYNVDRTIDVHVGKLRQKVERDPTQPTRILTVRGTGYMFRGPDEVTPDL